MIFSTKDYGDISYSAKSANGFWRHSLGQWRKNFLVTQPNQVTIEIIGGGGIKDLIGVL